MAADRGSTDFIGGFGDLSRDLMAGMLDQSEDCVKILDTDGRIDFINSNGRCIMEIDDCAAVAGQTWDSVWPDEISGQIRDAIAGAQWGSATRFEAFCPTAKGTPKWWEVTVTPVCTPDGEPFAIMAVSRDVSERRRASESLETMAQEMGHRLRNAFAISAAIAQTSGRAEPAHADFANTLAQRFGALSLVQSSLIDSGHDYTLDKLVRQIAEAFSTAGGLIAVRSMPDLTLDEDQVRFIALVLGELSSNSIKHGALGAGLPVGIAGSREGGTLVLEWSEALGGQLARPIGVTGGGGGSGQGLMQRMARAHGATFVVTLGTARLDARLELPVVR